MRRLVLIVAVWALLFSVPSPVRAQGEFPLEYREITGALSPLASGAADYVPPYPERPYQLTKMPEISGKATYFVWQTESGSLLMVLDSAQPPKLYVDMDRDNDLSDEEAIEGTVKTRRVGLLEALAFALGGSGPQRELRFGPITLPARDEGDEVQFDIQVEGTGGEYWYLLIKPTRVRAGEVELGGLTYKVEIIDAGFDGRYDGVFNVSPQYAYDAIAIDMNRDGVFQGSMRGPGEILPLPRMVKVNDAWYGVEVNPDGSAIRLERVEPTFGTLDAGTGDVKLMLLSDCGVHALAGSGGKWQLPEGRYAAQQITLTGTDEEGATWRLQAYCDTGKLSDFTIPGGGVRAFTVGPPLKVTTEVQSFPGIPQIQIGLAVRGGADEGYSPGGEKNGRRMPAPNFEILDEKGQVLTSSKFEYG